MNRDIIWSGPDALGESPMWHMAEQALYWIDIAKCLLHRLDPESGCHQSWQMSDFIGAVVPRKSGGVVVTVGNSIYSLDMPSGNMQCLAEITPWSHEWRMNDGKCDRRGRFWMGVAHLDLKHPEGGLYRLDPDGRVEQMETGITISNGLGWSPDNKTFYYTDGLKYCIYQYDFDLDTGCLGNRRPFLQLEKSPIEPDGLTIDEHGYIWQAQWNSGKIFRYAPTGILEDTIVLPVMRPTSCIFGGPDLNILYVTSCSQGIGETTSLPSPAGSVFALEVGVKGIIEPAFSG